jgi:hypothetical protein
MQLQSTLTCPKCGHQATEIMPTDACQFLYDCKGCGARLKPLAGDCCVFCSYGSVPCPPIQENKPPVEVKASVRSARSTAQAALNCRLQSSRSSPDPLPPPPGLP